MLLIYKDCVLVEKNQRLRVVKCLKTNSNKIFFICLTTLYETIADEFRVIWHERFLCSTNNLQIFVSSITSKSNSKFDNTTRDSVSNVLSAQSMSSKWSHLERFCSPKFCMHSFSSPFLTCNMPYVLWRSWITLLNMFYREKARLKTSGNHSFHIFILRLFLPILCHVHTSISFPPISIKTVMYNSYVFILQMAQVRTQGFHLCKNLRSTTAWDRRIIYT
jgi:hypothetical protein